MRCWRFRPETLGYGDTVEEAWEDARDTIENGLSEYLSDDLPDYVRWPDGDLNDDYENDDEEKRNGERELDDDGAASTLPVPSLGCAHRASSVVENPGNPRDQQSSTSERHTVRQIRLSMLVRRYLAQRRERQHRE